MIELIENPVFWLCLLGAFALGYMLGIIFTLSAEGVENGQKKNKTNEHTKR